MIGPLIEERLAKVAEYGSDWEGKPVREILASCRSMCSHGVTFAE